MAQVTIQIPTKPKRARKVHFKEATGTVAFFEIGGQKVKFVLQHGHNGKPESLVHYASGYVFGRLNEPKLSHYLARGSYATPLNDRGAAETLIARAVTNMGAETVLQKLASVPVINQ